MHRLVLAAILAVYAGLFARTIGYAYVWDDVHTLRDSDFFDRPLAEQLRVTEMQRIDPTIAALHGIAPAHESYRPITLLDQDLDVRIFGRGSPAPMHVHSLILGALTILLAFAIARRLLECTWAALAVAAIFALHPLHVEPFAYISARADLVSGILGLAALLLVLELSPERSRRARVLLAIGVALLFVASMFAKESIVGLPAVAFVIALALGRVRAWIPAWIAFAAAIVTYTLLRHVLIPDAPSPTTSHGAIDAALALPSLTLQYLRSFVVPFDISIVRQPDLPPIVGWTVAIGALAAVAFAWRTRRLGSRVALAAALLASSVLLLGPSAVAVSTLRAMADRYAYLSVLCFALVAVMAGRALIGRGGLAQRLVIGAAALWALLVVFVSHREIPAWTSNETLYAHAVAVEPTSALAKFHLGMLRYDEGDWEGAAALLESAAALDPTNDRALNNLAVCDMNLGKFDEAEAVLRRLLVATGGATFRPWYNLGTIQLHRGATSDACASFERALAINPAYARARADFDRNCTRR